MESPGGRRTSHPWRENRLDPARSDNPETGELSPIRSVRPIRGAEIQAAAQGFARGVRPAAVGECRDAPRLEPQGKGYGADGRASGVRRGDDAAAARDVGRS